MNKVEKTDLQHEFKKSHNKPGNPPTPNEDAKIIRESKKDMRTTD
jgi:hypothetical protein